MEQGACRGPSQGTQGGPPERADVPGAFRPDGRDGQGPWGRCSTPAWQSAGAQLGLGQPGSPGQGRAQGSGRPPFLLSQTGGAGPGQRTRLETLGDRRTGGLHGRLLQRQAVERQLSQPTAQHLCRALRTTGPELCGHGQELGKSCPVTDHWPEKVRREQPAVTGRSWEGNVHVRALRALAGSGDTRSLLPCRCWGARSHPSHFAVGS